jgi:hypothetical protein
MDKSPSSSAQYHYGPPAAAVCTESLSRVDDVMESPNADTQPIGY